MTLGLGSLSLTVHLTDDMIGRVHCQIYDQIKTAIIK